MLIVVSRILERLIFYLLGVIPTRLVLIVCLLLIDGATSEITVDFVLRGGKDAMPWDAFYDNSVFLTIFLVVKCHVFILHISSSAHLSRCELYLVYLCFENELNFCDSQSFGIFDLI